jgi:hypothetical protein
LAVSEEPAFQAPEDEDAIRHLMLNALDGLRPRSFVSLGPGSGDLDKEIVVGLQDPTLGYFPVDISEGLLFRSIQTMLDYASVPVGILSDFEERFPFVVAQLGHYIERPLLVGLLGHTLCNLDQFEATLLHQLGGWLRPDDHVLLHVTIASDSWDLTRAPLDASRHTMARRRFFAEGLARQLDDHRDGLLHGYEDRIGFSPGRSDVPGTVAATIVDRESGKTVQSFRWYRWPRFVDWIESRFPFKVVAQQTHLYAGQERGEGIALLRRR